MIRKSLATKHTHLLVARQALADAAVHFALIAETEPCISIRYDLALERAIQAMKDYTEASLRAGLTNQERIG